MAYINSTRNPAFFGEPPAVPRRLSLTGGGLQLQMPAFETITGFPSGDARLSSAQLAPVRRAAEFIARSWPGPSAIASVRITGYLEGNEAQSDLGQRRADAVRDALVSALENLRPGLTRRLRWITEDRGLSRVAKVEIYLWGGPTPQPVPPLVRVPSPAEVARRIVPAGPETAEQRIQRILQTQPPLRPTRQTFSGAFWQRVDDRLNSVMNRLNVPRSLRGPLRDGVHAAIRRGSEALMDQVLDASGLRGEARQAIKETVKAAGGLKVP